MRPELFAVYYRRCPVCGFAAGRAGRGRAGLLGKHHVFAAGRARSEVCPGSDTPWADALPLDAEDAHADARPRGAADLGGPGALAREP